MQVENLVSTIIPVFNRPQMIVEAVESVLAQTYRPIEILVVDDGSTDETPSVVARLAHSHPDEVSAFYVANGGPGAAREVGRKAARGEFIQYLDSDDLLLPDKFAAQTRGLWDNSDCQVAYGKTRCYEVGERPVDIAWKKTGEDIAVMFPSFLVERWWETSTPLYRRKVVDRAGPWTALLNEEDWEYDCRIAGQGVRLFNAGVFVSDTRVHSFTQLSNFGATPEHLRSRARARELMLGHARNAGLTDDAPEMQRFGRALFLLSRQCGAAGLRDESHRLFELAKEASGPSRANSLDFRVYSALAKTLGWRNAGRVSAVIDKVRR